MAEIKFDFKLSYDPDGDVLYGSFANDGEPVCTKNIDDLLLIDIGWYSGLPKGFCILGPKEHNLKSFRFKTVIQEAVDQFKNIMEIRRDEIASQEPVFAQINFEQMKRDFASII